MNFAFLNFRTIYTYKTKDGRKPSFENAACFSNFFNSPQELLNDVVKLTFTMCLTPKLLDSRHDNYCFLTVKEMKLWLNELKEWLDFDYVLRRRNDEDTKYMDVKLTMRGTHFAHKMILTLARYMYETKYTIPLKEALKLQQYGYYPELNLFNKFLVTSMCVSGYAGGHCVGLNDEVYEFYSTQQLKKQLEKCKNKNYGLKCILKIKDDVRWQRKQIDVNKIFLSKDQNKLLYSKRNIIQRVREYHNINYQLSQ